MRRLALLVFVFLGCGPLDNPGNLDPNNPDPVDAGGSDSSPNNTTASVTGTVWAPGQAPGMVPAGQEIPIFNALVRVSHSRAEPIPQETYCERCINPSGQYVFSDHEGNFTLHNIMPGNYWLTIQKGQFRLEQQIVLGDRQNLQLTAEQSTLPSESDPDNGKWIPRIALAVGSSDHLEDILGKMGIGRVDDSGEYVPSSAAGIFDVYKNGGSWYPGTTVGTLTELVSDLNRMLQYHIIFIPCTTDPAGQTTLRNQNNLRNIRDFVAAGGKLYVTDWSGEWSDNVFPAQIQLDDPANPFDDGLDTPASAYDASTDTWNTSLFGHANGSNYDSNNAEVVDADLERWLDTQRGPIVEDYNANADFNPSRFTVEGNWNTIYSLNQVQIGMDDEGLPILDTPRAYIIGGRGNGTPKRPLTVTYEPAGCGRVLYSTYHTTDNTHHGLVPQERVLVYLIMEIGVCQEGPIVD